MIGRCLAAALFATTAWAPAQTVNIRVFTLFHPTELRLASAQNATVVLKAGDVRVVLNNEHDHRSAQILLESGHLLLNGTPVPSIHAASRGGDPVDFTLSIPGRISRHYQGTLLVTAGPHSLQPVVAMDTETAVASVVAAEMPPSTPLEAMKAQAVAARSFLAAGGPHSDGEFCDTTHCQFLRDPPPPSSRAAIATRQTRGLVLTWHGQPLAAMYSRRCGGTTRTLHDIGVPAQGYPYFAVECTWCRRHPSTWTRALSTSDGRNLKSSNEQARLALDRAHGWSAIPSNNYHAISGLDGLILQGQGEGHGLGLCQFGAAGMAEEGAGFAEILRHYYPETELKTLPPPDSAVR